MITSVSVPTLGQFILSINDVPEVRALFHWADIEAVERTYTIGEGDAITAAELLISRITSRREPGLF